MYTIRGSSVMNSEIKHIHGKRVAAARHLISSGFDLLQIVDTLNSRRQWRCIRRRRRIRRRRDLIICGLLLMILSCLWMLLMLLLMINLLLLLMSWRRHSWWWYETFRLILKLLQHVGVRVHTDWAVVWVVKYGCHCLFLNAYIGLEFIYFE